MLGENLEQSSNPGETVLGLSGELSEPVRAQKFPYAEIAARLGTSDGHQEVQIVHKSHRSHKVSAVNFTRNTQYLYKEACEILAWT